jgi:hypothetical protein
MSLQAVSGHEFSYQERLEGINLIQVLVCIPLIGGCWHNGWH